MLPGISGCAARAGSIQLSITQNPRPTHPSKAPRQIFMTSKIENRDLRRLAPVTIASRALGRAEGGGGKARTAHSRQPSLITSDNICHIKSIGVASDSFSLASETNEHHQTHYDPQNPDQCQQTPWGFKAPSRQ